MLAKNEILQGRYRIVRQLGHGGMGAVYEAIDERFGEPIALKEIIIKVDCEKQKRLITNAFEREAKSLAKARHEAIPYVRDYFSELDRQFLVMELVEGDDLAEMLKVRKNSFPLEDVLQWIDQLLDALDYLHNLQPPIIHRDVKPQNLKLSFRRKIKLLDFGLAKSTDSTSSNASHHTFAGATLHYSPIEQILRVLEPAYRELIISNHKEKAENVLRQNTDARCDFYAVGATFYHLLTNRLPIDSIKRTLDIWKGKSDPMPSPSQLNPEIPQSISDCLLKAMEIGRDDRYSSAIEMQKALQKAISEEKNPLVIEPNNLPNKAEERKHQEQALPKATIEKPPAEDEVILLTQPSPTQASIEISSEGKSPAEIPVIDSSLKELAEIQPSENKSESELTKTPYYDEQLFNDEVDLPESLLIEEIETIPSKNRKPIWIFPIIALGVLTVSGIGGIFWMSSSSAIDSNKSAVNVSISTPTATPITSPTISPSVPPTSSPIPKKVETKGEVPKPTVISKPKKPPIQNPGRTPLPQKTKKPTPPRNLDCIYTNDCE